MCSPAAGAARAGLPGLAADIAAQQHKRTAALAAGGEIQYRFLYFNHMNLAEKTSFATLVRRVGPAGHPG